MTLQSWREQQIMWFILRLFSYSLQSQWFLSKTDSHHLWKTGPRSAPKMRKYHQDFPVCHESARVKSTFHTSHSGYRRKSLFYLLAWLSNGEVHLLPPYRAFHCRPSVDSPAWSVASQPEFMEPLWTSFVVLQVFCLAAGYPSGAPTGACEDMMPRHTGVLPQPSPAPFALLTNTKTFQPGKPITGSVGCSHTHSRRL